MKKLAIVAALPAEAACLYDKKLNPLSPVEIKEGIYLCLSGIGYDAASQAAKKCIDLDINTLVSWGIAGALDPAIDSGDLVIAKTIIDGDKNYQSSSALAEKLLSFFSEKKTTVLNASISSDNNICATVKDKNNLFIKTGAIAVDMESAAIAATALDNNLDFIVIRSIADKADLTIPEAVLKYTDDMGNPVIIKFIYSCIKKPDQIMDLFKLACSYKKALKSLKEIASPLKNSVSNIPE